MISEESRDTEDWSNDAENTAFAIALINNILKSIKIEEQVLYTSNIVSS